MGYIKLTQKANGVINVNALLTSFTYGGVTHKNRTDRYNIREAIWIADLQYRINGGAWVKKGAISTIDIPLSRNGDKLEVKVHYRYDTQGYHHKNTNLPFFYYTDQNGNVANHKGYKTNGSCPWPNGGLVEARTACKLPNNWTPVGGGKSNTSVSWTNWAKSHSETSNNLWWKDGPQYEQRHANHFGSYSDGWFSNQGRWNYYRRSCLWRWECQETASIICSNISSTNNKKPSTPSIIVHDAYGPNGKVTLTNNDSFTGYMRLGAWLKTGKDGPNVDGTWRWILLGKEGIKVNNTGIHSNKCGPGKSLDVNVDFYELFGEQYEGKKVYYQLNIENENNNQSDNTDTKGHHHHFNARPTIPTVTLKRNGNTLNGSWSAIDPDPRGQSYVLAASLLTYDVQLETMYPDGNRKIEYIANKTQTTSTSISIKDSDEGASYLLKVRSHDGRIYSKDWGYSDKSMAAYKAIQPRIVYPIDDSIVYNTTPRFIIRTEAKGATDVLVVKFNGKTFKSNIDTDCFSDEYIPKGVNFMAFRPNNAGTGKFEISAFSENDNNTSAITSSNLIINSLDLYLDNEYIGAEDFMNLEKHISNVSNAYGLGEYYTDGAYGYICAEDANIHMEHVYNINYSIKRLNPNLAPDLYTTIKIPGISYITTDDYNGIIKDLKNM